MSIRAVKRWCKRHYAEFRNSDRAKSVAVEMALALKQEIDLVSAGAAGRDSIYWVESHGNRFAVLRLVNPYKKREPMPSASPFVWLDDSERIDNEWKAYSLGAKAGVTPEPIWRCDDAIACKYLPWPPLFAQLVQAPERYWEFVCQATKELARLHAAGLTHMDGNLANLLVDPVSGKGVFVDFEYGPADFIDVSQQRAYDFLRLVDGSLKFCAPEVRLNFDPWVCLLKELVDEEVRDVILKPLHPALGRLLNEADLCTALKTVFTHLD